MNPAKFDAPYSPTDPHPSQFNSPMFDGHPQAAYANTSGAYATPGHPGLTPTPAQLSVKSTVDGRATNSGQQSIQPVAHTEQKVKVQDREGRIRIYEIDSGKHPEWKVRLL